MIFLLKNKNDFRLNKVTLLSIEFYKGILIMTLNDQIDYQIC